MFRKSFSLDLGDQVKTRGIESRITRDEDRLRFERPLWMNGMLRVAGVDEAGRGPLAGPVVAAAVILPASWCRTGVPKDFADLNDSKQLSEDQREAFFARIIAVAEITFAIARVEASEIDRINILQATHLAMNQALALLPARPEHVLVDGLRVKSMPFPHTPLVQGDARSYSIAAASVLAKVTRDRWMKEYDQLYPEYGFAAHKGYGTDRHFESLRTHGPCPIHRRTFSPLKQDQLEFSELVPDTPPKCTLENSPTGPLPTR